LVVFTRASTTTHHTNVSCEESLANLWILLKKKGGGGDWGEKKRVMDQERPISFFFSLSLSNLSFLFRAPILLLPIHQDLFHIQKAIISIQKQQHSIQLPKTPIVQTSNTTIPIAALYLDQATIHCFVMMDDGHSRFIPCSL
jgi:hypothetical protein